MKLHENSTVGGKQIQVHGERLSQERVVIDDEGIATTIEYRRVDETLFKKSVLSGGTSPQYEVRTETYYDADGTTEIMPPIIYDITYDDDGNFLKEVPRS